MKLTEKYLVGIDLGTTNIKAIIMSDEGKVIASSSRENKLILPGPNMAEQDANGWWENAKEILNDITKAAGKDITKRIAGISVSSQTVTMLPVDKDGNPLRNALIWMDNRSALELDEIIDILGRDHFVSIIGGQPDVAFLPGKLLWFKNNERELFDKTKKVLQASSFINLKLTGEMTMDLDQASRSQCLDIKTLKWSSEVGDALGINLDEILPTPEPISKVIGYVTPEAASLTGLVAGIPVVAGASDAMASMYAIGLSQTSEIGESSGTTSLVFVGSTKASATNVPVVTKPCDIDGMPYVFDAPINTSGASLKWYLDNFGEEPKRIAEAKGINVYDYLNQVAADVPAGSNGLIYFPYLLGERAPLWNSYAKGMFIGMSMNTTRNDVIRSIFEGTAFALRHVIETVKESGADPKVLRITGGGSKSRTWCQIKASMLNMPVHILSDDSGDVPMGDALIAGKAVGVFEDLTKTMSNIIKVKEVIEPVPEWTRAYDKLYPFYIDMYKHLDRDLFNMARIMD